MVTSLRPLGSLPPRNEAPHETEVPVFALLTNSFDDEHEAALVRGAAIAARELDVTLMCIPGGVVGDTDPDEKERGFVFDAIGAPIRGVLVMTSAIGHIAGPKGLETWMERFRPLPTCVLGVPVEGHPNVVVDNFGGMREAVLHLVRAHGKRRIAFIRGPEGSSEALDRFRAYQDALTSEGIEIEDRLVVDGDFTKPSGTKAVRTLLDARRVSPATLDGIVGANDFMAIGALEELLDRGIFVPEQLAVLGFDDVESARAVSPALTTVRQSGELIGRDGMKRLFALYRGETIAPSQVLPTELIVRHSCGCAESEGVARQTSMPTLGRGVEASFMQRRQVIVAELARAARGQFVGAGEGWESRLLDALITDLRAPNSRALHRVLAQLLLRMERAGGDGSCVQEILTATRAQSLPCVVQDPLARERLEDALHDARVAAAAMVVRATTGRIREITDRLRDFTRRVHARMFDDEAGVGRAAAELLRPLGIEAGLVAEIETTDEPSIATPSGSAPLAIGQDEKGKTARVTFAFGSGVERLVGMTMPAGALISHDLLRSGKRTLVALPLINAGKPVGIAVVATAAIEGPLLEELRDVFAVAVRAAKIARASRTAG